jgi:ATP-dependent DNA helicase RecG
MERMGLKDKSNFLENYLYTEQPKLPKQKYRLTEKENTQLK